MINSILAMTAGAGFSSAFVAPEPYWGIGMMIAIVCICILRSRP